MNSATLRRLAADHSSLHTSGLPPNYLFPSDDSSANADDLTQLTVLLTGSQGTPYSQGLWRLHLKIPDDYPKSPPKASFKTRIWHPNVEESTGSVCVDTLKKDWESKLTLRDILITISCLLIHPNPDSALNSAAGQLQQDDYEAFARQAKLMTSIHAQIPPKMKAAVKEARMRGDEGGIEMAEEQDQRPAGPRTTSSSSSVVMKKKIFLSGSRPQSSGSDVHAASAVGIGIDIASGVNDSRLTIISRTDGDAAEEEEDPAAESKENDPSLSPSPVSPIPTSPRRNVLGKRPLSALPTPVDPDADDEEDEDAMSPSEQNIANHVLHTPQAFHPQAGAPSRKSPKLSELSKGVNSSGRIREEMQIYEDSNNGEGKENLGSGGEKAVTIKQPVNTGIASSTSSVAPKLPAARKMSTTSTNSGKGKARAGLRRL